MTLPVWIEVHVDDFVLSRDPARWPDAAALLDSVARRAEEAGARLTFRIMEPFARGDREGFLAGLVGRGHEVGWHTHGKGLDSTIAALDAAGVPDARRIGTPGLVQVGDRGRLRLLQKARTLGMRLVTDRLEARHHAYQGWLAWEVLPGLVSLDVSVNPFDWGVLHREGDRVRHGYGTMDWGRLDARLAAREAMVPPPGEAAYFGATLHEHNLCAEGSLTPLPAALDAMARFLDRRGPAVVPSAAVLEGSRWATASPDDPPRAVRATPLTARARRAWKKLAWRADPHPFRPDPEPRAVGEHRVHHSLPGYRDDFWLQVGTRRVAVRRIGLASARAVVVTAHGGKSGIEQGLSFVGLDDDALVSEEVALYLFERSEGARTPGNPVHVEDTRAVLRHALAEGPPVGLLTWSAGVVPMLRAVLEGGDPPAVAFLMDCEGPCDRFSVVPPDKPEHELASADVHDDAPWAGREAIEYIAAFPAPYHRIQAATDHVHGPMVAHARRMVAAAREGRLNGAGEILSGQLWEHGGEVRAWIGERVRALPVPRRGA